MTKPPRGDRKLRRGSFNLVKKFSARRIHSESSLSNAQDKRAQQVEQVPPAIHHVVQRREIISSPDSGREGSGEDGVGSRAEEDVSLLVVDVPEVETQSSPIDTWLRDADALVHSNEMSSFLASTGEVAMYATKTAVHVAALPVTVPLHVVSFTTDMVVGTCARAVGSLCHAVNQAIHPTGGENTASFHPVEGLIRNVTGMVPFMLHAANKIKDDIGSSLLGMISPALIGDGEEHGAMMGSPIRRSASSCAGESSAEQATFLERLRLDYPSSESLADSKVVEVPTKSLKVSPRSPDVSKYLLRVCDLGLSLQSDGDRHERVYYIDLSKEYANEQLTMRAIDSLVENGLALISSCPEVQFGQKSGCDSLVDWKAENSTTKLLKRKSKLSEKDWTSLLAREVLVWSGKLRSKDAHKADVPVFLSRGILPLSPRELLHLFWDDSRTRDYNKFSLGRSTSMEIEQGVANNDDAPPRGTKVVQSETQVPFTGFSVVMSTLMHARQLDDPETYVIVSRSLNPGRAGSHVGSSSAEGSKNELVWGVNLLRSVPNNPDLSDLTSVSQLSSSMVVQFLTHRVGIMAVESFFNAVRES